VYGKDTVVRFAQEANWAQLPSSGWQQVGCLHAKVSLSGRADSYETSQAAEAGPEYAVARLEAAPDAANLEALAAAALSRDSDGELGSYTLEVSDAAGARRVLGALARRFRLRAGIARPVLEFSFEWVGRNCESAAAFASAGGARGFAFQGSSCLVDAAPVDLKEFSLSVNNNIFPGPSAEDAGVSFLTAGRQAVNGYLCLAGDRRDLVDSEAHALSVTLPGEGGDAVVSAAQVAFTWCREIRSVSEGALQVLYFEGAGGAITGGVDVTFSPEA